ncbi:UDP-glucose 4-epimerase GalE [Mycoplasma mycoides]|uniref:UDP-glucose 4-epimerase GalE n=1 Tax=Mycoplasma mycoides TaxID=2102 RepID=UPI00223FE0F9|nr:UDP-glucose 4-epimerase GalE [Mycoplasma mycoides]QVK05128.1 UDP-glucose 4-epimerase GalE [Mycoplasma mycoides subsp. capri]
MNYLLIGGAGYIGSHVAEIINKTDNKVIIYDNLSSGSSDFIEQKSTFIQGDILDFDKLNEVFGSNKIDVVIYLAGLIKVGESVQKPLDYYQTNILGLVNTLKIMQIHNVNYFVFSSSAAVYGNNSRHNGFFYEDDPKEPCSPYGRTKYFGEEIIKDFAIANPNFHYTFLRYFNVAGASKSKRIGYLTQNNNKPTHLIPAISYFAFGLTDKFSIFGSDYNTNDGTCIRDYVYVCELAELHLLTAQKMVKENRNLYYNIGSGKGFSNLEIIKEFERQLGYKLDIDIAQRRSGDPDILVASNTKLCQELNYEIKTNIKDIVESEIAFRKAHLKNK